MHDQLKPCNRDGRQARRSALVRFLALVLAGLALGVIALGCDASAKPGVAKADTTATTTGQPTTRSGSGDAVAYAACMRRNGVPQFPDPDANGRLRFPKDLVRSPRLRAAMRACRPLLPTLPAPDSRQLAEALRLGVRYSACMRAHGVPNFPDPRATQQGGIRFDYHAPDSRRFEAADRACIKLGRAMKNALR
jgi:hypothetical protein